MYAMLSVNLQPECQESQAPKAAEKNYRQCFRVRVSVPGNIKTHFLIINCDLILCQIKSNYYNNKQIITIYKETITHPGSQ